MENNNKSIVFKSQNIEIQRNDNQNDSSILTYTSEDGSVELEVKFKDETVWLNRSQMAMLFERDYKTIAKHINNALKEELEGESVVAKFATTKNYGRVEGYTQLQEIEYYNLDMIMSVGFRVKSKRGVEFRKWAKDILKQYVIKGYAINQRQLDHYNELKDVVKLMSRALQIPATVTNVLPQCFSFGLWRKTAFCIQKMAASGLRITPWWPLL